MTDSNQNLFYHLDDLRIDSGISIADFCDGICDRRQYSRYKNGTQEVSLKNITKFYEKLGFSQIEFYYSFYNSEASDYQKVLRLFYSLMDQDYKKAKDLIIALEKTGIQGERSQRFFDYCILLMNYETKKVSSSHTYELMQRLIDYPNCLSKTHFDFIDMSALRIISKIEFETKTYTALEFLYNSLLDMKFIYVSSEDRNILSSIYSNVARQYGMLDELEKVLAITDLGIKFCISINSMVQLEHLYYYKSLAHYKMGNHDDAFICARKSLAIVYAKNNKERLNQFTNVMTKDFGFDASKLFNSDFNVFI